MTILPFSVQTSSSRDAFLRFLAGYVDGIFDVAGEPDLCAFFVRGDEKVVTVRRFASEEDLATWMTFHGPDYGWKELLGTDYAAAEVARLRAAREGRVPLDPRRSR